MLFSFSVSCGASQLGGILCLQFRADTAGRCFRLHDRNGAWLVVIEWTCWDGVGTEHLFFSWFRCRSLEKLPSCRVVVRMIFYIIVLVIFLQLVGIFFDKFYLVGQHKNSNCFCEVDLQSGRKSEVPLDLRALFHPPPPPPPPHLNLSFEELLLRCHNDTKCCMVNEITNVNTIVLHSLHRKITCLAIILRKSF